MTQNLKALRGYGLGERAPKPGDKVRVAVEGIVSRINPLYVNVPNGQDVALYNAVSVEVLEPADDPSKDPIGTVRQKPAPVQCLAIKARPNRWITLRESDAGIIQPWTDGDVTDWPKQSLAEVAKVFGHPEPEASKRVFGDCDGELWFEIEPNSFTLGSTREIAEGYHNDENDKVWVRYTLDRLRGKYGPLKDVTHEHA